MTLEATEAPIWRQLCSSDAKGYIGERLFSIVASGSRLVLSTPEMGMDRVALDFWVHFRGTSVGVQVKYVTNPRLVGDTYAVHVTAEWTRHWNAAEYPVYLVLVAGHAEVMGLLVHEEDHLRISTSIHWVQVNDARPGTLHVPVKNVLTDQALEGWYLESTSYRTPAA